MRVVVTGMGLQSALGTSLQTSWQNLIAGQSGIKIHQPFLELEPLPLGMIADRPQTLGEITAPILTSALLDAGLSLSSPLVDTGVVIGSSRGFQAQWEAITRSGYTDNNQAENWLENLPHMNAIAIARKIGATGIVQAPMAACATGIVAIAQATSLIQSGQCHRVITGAIEAPITPLTITGFRQMGALAKTGAYPFDRERQGLVLGEGGVILVLESLELAQQRQAQIYGEILGFALTNDAYHPNAPDPSGKGAIIAIQKCLQRSFRQVSDIEYIHAHGTATIRNDTVESQIIQTVFTNHPYVSSTKGATGHTIGASGALGVAFSLMALKTQILPPCVGLNNSEFPLNLLNTAKEIPVQNIICWSFGFGGTNAAIALASID